ncbi:hypothetical protein [Paraburkholderia sp. ZP32-5]|uniref:hypothetical protein n=1 Tax=Paraburkholderia sp. ZP32-5 TaxID=2883245 RepID=UPI001F3C0C1B|nr:hypothetical protein [Paraburkholderia sp. ZP32-5]
MNTRNIQTFLMVSAAFFAMSAPARSNPGSMGALSNAISRTARVAPARLAANRDERFILTDERKQNS